VRLEDKTKWPYLGKGKIIITDRIKDSSNI